MPRISYPGSAVAGAGGAAERRARWGAPLALCNWMKRTGTP
jgi:hypothetical protein